MMEGERKRTPVIGHLNSDTFSGNRYRYITHPEIVKDSKMCLAKLLQLGATLPVFGPSNKSTFFPDG